MLTGKTALVTGSTSGIGLGIARELARQGANIVLNGYGAASELANLRAELAQTHGVAVRHDAADLNRPEAIEAMMARALAEFGCIELLVNNASTPQPAPVDEIPAEHLYAILGFHLSSVFHTTRAALPAMRRKGFGRIVNIASAHTRVASPYKSACVSARHGVAAFTKNVALEAGEADITVNAICPGYVLRPLVDRQMPCNTRTRGRDPAPPANDVLLAAQPTKKFVTAEQVAALTAFLCTDAASSISGATLPIEGGWTSH